MIVKTSRRFVASSSALLTTSPHFMQSGLHVRQHSHAYTRGNMNCLLWLMRHGADTININTLLSHFPTLTFSHEGAVSMLSTCRHSQKTRVKSACSVSEVSAHCLTASLYTTPPTLRELCHRLAAPHQAQSMQPVLQWKLNKL